jgi:hypothetical protein
MNLLEEVIIKFGIKHQITKCIEEMAELMVELTKYLNMSNEITQAQLVQLESNVCSEIADAQITLSQMKLLFPDWKQHEDRKLKRLEEMVK